MLPGVAGAEPKRGDLESARARSRADLRRMNEREARLRALRPGAVSRNGWPIETSINAGGVIWTQVVPGSEVMYRDEHRWRCPMGRLSRRTDETHFEIALSPSDSRIRDIADRLRRNAGR